MPSEESRLRELNNKHIAPGNTLSVTFEEAEELIKQDPMQQLPGEGDKQYAAFVSFILNGEETDIVTWHREYDRNNWTLQHVYRLAGMFRWRKRRAVRMLGELEDMRRRSRHKIFEAHFVGAHVAKEYIEQLITAGMAEESPIKAKALLETARHFGANLNRNQEANERIDVNKEVEMARIKAAHVTETEDLD